MHPHTHQVWNLSTAAIHCTLRYHVNNISNVWPLMIPDDCWSPPRMVEFISPKGIHTHKFEIHGQPSNLERLCYTFSSIWNRGNQLYFDFTKNQHLSLHHIPHTKYKICKLHIFSWISSDIMRETFSEFFPLVTYYTLIKFYNALYPRSKIQLGSKPSTTGLWPFDLHEQDQQ